MCLRKGYFSPGKRYVGKTVETLEERFRVHKSDSKRSNSKVNRFISRVGAENLKMVLLQTTFCPLYAAYLEWYYWKRFSPGLNTLEPNLGVLLGEKEYGKLRNRRWDQTNPGRKGELLRAWQKANSEWFVQLQRKCYKRNKEVVCKRARAYNEKNKEELCARKRGHRASNMEVARKKARVYYAENRDRINALKSYNYALKNGKQPDPADVPLPPPDEEGL